MALQQLHGFAATQSEAYENSGLHIAASLFEVARSAVF